MITEPLVLIIGQCPDPHIDAVSDALERLGVPVVCLQRHSRLHTLTLRFGPKGHSQCFSTTGNQDFDFSKVRSVWWRMKPHVPSEFSGGVSTLVERFVVTEWGNALKALPTFLTHAKWVNPLTNHELTSYKPRQLKLAIEVGLSIPETVISNCIEDVAELFLRHASVIYKSLSSFVIPPDHIIYTTKISKEELLKSERSFKAAPGIFQEYVEKKHELRVTVVGEQVFVVSIDSQASSETATDWRRDQLRPMYEVNELSSQTLQSLRLFHEKAGLVYGAYDFIVTKDGREIFLECNPGGQWLWLERALNLNITSALAQELACI